jgi:glycosyl transferase family 11
MTTFVTFDLLGKLGRLGNQLFQIAATIGAARRNHCACTFPAWPYEAYFADGLPRTPGRPPPRPPLLEQSYLFKPIEILETCHLVGYFQSEKYFAHCADEIRRVFTPHPAICSQIAARFGAILERQPCAIHVRRADYTSSSDYAQLWNTDYYRRAIDSFERDRQFLVFSDDIAWCRTYFDGLRFEFVEGFSDVADFFLMGSCAHHIIANSSFSWWPAWLNTNPTKRVVAPRAWFAGEFADPRQPFVPGLPQRGYHDTRDLIPESWEAL